MAQAWGTCKDMDIDSHNRNGRGEHDNGRREEVRRHGRGHRHVPRIHGKLCTDNGRFAYTQPGYRDCGRLRHLDGVGYRRERELPVPVLPDGPGYGRVIHHSPAYRASNTWNWATTCAMAGSNSITVSVKDSTGATATVSGAYTLSASTPPPLSDGLAVNPTTATAWTTVTCTSTASGGSGGYQYQFSRSGPDTSGTYVVAQGYGTSSSWNWATTSAMAGSNTIKVTVKDSSGATTTNSDAYTLAAAGTSTGNSYYMAPTGSDSNSGTISAPWKTITYAVAKLKAGDTLYARGGTYSEQGSSNNWPYRVGNRNRANHHQGVSRRDARI